MKTSSPTTIWFDRQGDNWFEGLPVGNGRTGAMVTGGLPSQTLRLNDETFWSPAPRERDLAGAREAMDAVRKLIAVGDILGAQAAASALLGTPHLVAALQPVGDLVLATDLDTTGATFTRSLELATGVATLAWNWGDGHSIVREIVASREPSVFVVRQRSTADVGATRVSLSSPFGIESATTTDDTVLGSGQWHEVEPNRRLVADSYRLRDFSEGRHLRFAVGFRAVEGEASHSGDALELTSANWTIVVALGTDFGLLDPAICVGNVLREFDGSGDELIETAIVAHAEVFGRASIRLDLPTPPGNLSTDRRVHAVRAGGIDDELVLLLSDYGRYLQIASTLGGDLPPTLQGIWNADTEPAWGSGWTLNINLQMALWSADAYGFVEALDTLYDFVEQLSITGRRTATELYGAEGWAVHNNSDVWMNTVPTTLVEVGLFAASGPWLVQQLWRHHESYPELGNAGRLFRLVEGVVKFFETWLVVDADGFLAPSPSSTPENGYLLGDTPRPRSRAIDPEYWRHGWIGQAPTLDMWLVRDTLHTAIALGTSLGEPAERLDAWRSTLKRLRPVPIQDGEIPEWTWPYRALEVGHRHLSPLYALYPGTDDFESPSELRDAARLTLGNRQANVTSSSNGWGGWSRVWAAACWARLGEGDRALASIDALVRTGIAPDSLLHAFPDFDGVPAPDAVHQSDANFGLTAAVAEFVVRSVPGDIRLLPALPGRWLKGSVRGIRARGGVRVDFDWNGGWVERATLVATVDQTVTISAPGTPGASRLSRTVDLTVDVPLVVSFADDGLRLQRGNTK
jgi:alpha-L-fucosidase 2